MNFKILCIDWSEKYVLIINFIVYFYFIFYDKFYYRNFFKATNLELYIFLSNFDQCRKQDLRIGSDSHKKFFIYDLSF